MPPRNRRFVVLTALAAVCAIVPASSQQPQVFRLEVNLVTQDIIVVDREGRPVTGLQAGDFSVTVDGQPRKVVSAQFLSSAASAPAGSPEAARQTRFDIDDAFETVYVANDRAAGAGAAMSRNVIVAIDQNSFSMSAGKNAATAARGLLDLLHPSDRVGLAVFPPPGPSVSPTRDHSRVRTALGQVTGIAESMPRTDSALTVTDALTWQSGDSTSRNGILERACALRPQSVSETGASSFDACQQTLDGAVPQVLHYAQRQSLVSLQGLTDVVAAAGASGVPTAVVLVSGGLFGGGYAPQFGVDEELRMLGRLAAESRVTLYALYVESGFLDRDSMDRARVTGFSAADGDLRLEGLRHLAGLSAGTVTRVSSGSDAGFRRVSQELSAYYLVGFESAPSDRDGRRHRIRVNVARPGVTIRSREDLYLPAERKLGGDEAVKAALAARQFDRALPIRLSTQMMREAGSDKVRVLISAYIDRDVTSPAQVRVGYSIQGTTGATGTSNVENRRLPVVGAGPDASLAYVETAQVTPGRYRLRVAALASDGRLGSVERIIDALLVGGEGVALSDLLLVDPRRTVKDAFAPVADGRMTSDGLEAFLELYPQHAQQVGSVVFEVADMPGGPALVGGSVAPERKEEGRLTAGAALDLGQLPPGTYALNARVLDGERLLARTSRPFRLERMPGAGTGPRALFGFAATGGVVRNFARADALRAEALDYFIGRLGAAETAQTGETVASAAEALRGSRFDEAVTALSGEGSDVLSVVFLKGLALFGQGQLEPAARQFRSALRISNDFLPAAFYLGACYAAGGRDREAVGAWQTSLVSETESRIVYEVLADALLRLKDGQQAEAIISEAQERWPGDERFTPRLAAARVILDRRNEALALLAPYIDRHPAEAEPLFLAIRLLYEGFEAGKPIRSAAEDREQARQYGVLYSQTGGANQPLVARWVAALQPKVPRR